MTAIAILGKANIAQAATIMRIAKCTADSISEVKRKIQNNEPIFVAEIFMNNHGDVKAIIESLVQILKSSDTGIRIFELQSISEIFHDSSEIDEETLNNIIAF